MKLSVARWTIDLQVSQAALAGLLERRYCDFRCNPASETDLAVEVRHEAPGRDNDCVESILDAAVVAIGENYLLDGAEFYGIIEPLNGRASLWTRSSEPAREVEYFLRIALAFFALRRDGLLIHCAALRRDSTVRLFVGQSGSGKSTVAALSETAGRATALGDDLILLRREGRGWQAYGTPFWNHEATNRKSQLEHGRVVAVYKLVQDRSVFLEPMSRAAAAGELFANCPIVNDQPALLSMLIDRCRDLATGIPVQRLHFRRDDAFWDVILQEAP